MWIGYGSVGSPALFVVVGDRGGGDEEGRDGRVERREVGGERAGAAELGEQHEEDCVEGQLAAGLCSFRSLQVPHRHCQLQELAIVTLTASFCRKTCFAVTEICSCLSLRWKWGIFAVCVIHCFCCCFRHYMNWNCIVIVIQIVYSSC